MFQEASRKERKDDEGMKGSGGKNNEGKDRTGRVKVKDMNGMKWMKE